jgi:uncharacterized peroxidase-related enzyme
MAYIHTIEPEDAEGELKEVYEDLMKKRGKLAEVHKLQSLNPRSIVAHMDLYMSIMFGSSPLKRPQREMMAVVVSRENDCLYCQKHHGAALSHFWKEEGTVEAFRKDPGSIELSDPDRALCEMAVRLTQDPSASSEERIEVLRSQGFSDRAILDATLVVSYFNFVNRMVMGLGVELEADEGKGYEYDG